MVRGIGPGCESWVVAGAHCVLLTARVAGCRCCRVGVARVLVRPVRTPVRREVLRAICRDPGGRRVQGGWPTLCASSATTTFPVSTPARTNSLVTVSESARAIAGSKKGSEGSTIVGYPILNPAFFLLGLVETKDWDRTRRCF